MRNAIELLEALCGFLDESAITVQDDSTQLYAGGIDLQPLGKKLTENDFVATVKEAKELVRITKQHDADRWDQLKQDHAPAPRERSGDYEEHGTYHNQDGKA